MTRKLKTLEVVTLYNLLKPASLARLEESDKFKMFRLMRKLKDVVVKFNDVKDDAMVSFRGSEHDDMVHKYQSGDRSNDTMRYILEYEKNVNKAIDGELKLEHEFEIEVLSEESVYSLASGNDWTFERAEPLINLLS